MVTDDSEPLEIAPRIILAPRGGWRAARVALLAEVAVTALVGRATFGRLEARMAEALIFGVGMATALTVYQLCRVDRAGQARSSVSRLMVTWIALAVLFGAGRLLLFR